MNKDQAPTIADLYPDLTPEEQEEAAMNLQQYIDLVGRIYDRLEREERLDEIEALPLRHQWKKRNDPDGDIELIWLK